MWQSTLPRKTILLTVFVLLWNEERMRIPERTASYRLHYFMTFPKVQFLTIKRFASP